MNTLEFQSGVFPNSSKRCPVCGQSSRRLFCKDGYWLRDCQGCGHRFVEFTPASHHTAQIYGDDYFQGGGAGYPNYLAEAHLLRQQGRRYARLMQRYTQPGTVLDVGAAAGLILQGFVDQGWQGSGVEPNPRMAQYARSCLGLDMCTGSLEQLQPDQQYDLVAMIQVIAHFYDLRQAMQSADAFTRPGGYWLIETWNRTSWTARILRSHWHEYSPPSVLHWFSPQGVRALAAQFGYRPLAWGRPQKFINGAHAKSLLRYKLGRSAIASLIYQPFALIPDHLTLPYPAEDLFWMLLRKDP